MILEIKSAIFSAWAESRSTDVLIAIEADGKRGAYDAVKISSDWTQRRRKLHSDRRFWFLYDGPDIATFWLRVKSGTFQAYSSCECTTQQFCDFVKQLQEMYEFRCFNATLSAMYYGSSVTLTLDKKGHIKAAGKIFDDGTEQCLTFSFETDRSELPPFINGLKNMIS